VTQAATDSFEVIVTDPPSRWPGRSRRTCSSMAPGTLNIDGCRIGVPVLPVARERGAVAY
jgi:hypothetical protein